MDSYSDEANPDDGCDLAEPKFVMDLEAAKEYVEFLAKYPRHKQICICGHTINSHTFSTGGGYSCHTANVWCYCSMPTPVFYASDARVFKRSTHGFGRKHALGLGIASLHARGGTGEWLIAMKCEASDCTETELTVACLDSQNLVVAKSTENSRLLCHKHAWELGGWRL